MKLSRVFLTALFVGAFCFSSIAIHAQTDTSTDAKKVLPERLKTGVPKSIEDVKLFESHIQTLLKKIRPATVNVGGGTGVVVSEDGLILTVQHVNRQAGRRLTVTFPDGRQARAITLGGYQGVDGGMMKITEEGKYPFVDMGDSSKLKKGQWCVALGYPVTYSRGSEPPVRVGRVLSVPGQAGTTVMTDCTIMGGDSGGPLFDLDGKVIGVHSRVNNLLTRNIHVPVNIYRDNWDRFLASEEWSNRSRSRQTAYLGVRRKNSDVTDALVSEVVKGSAAEKAGIKPGDLIVEFSGTKIESFQHLLEQIARKRPGQRVEFKVKRGDETLTLNARLGTRTGG